MANGLSRIMTATRRVMRSELGIEVRFLAPAGTALGVRDPLDGLEGAVRLRSYAIQDSLSAGGPVVLERVQGLVTWVVALEDRRKIHGGMLGPVALLDGVGGDGRAGLVRALTKAGLAESDAAAAVADLPLCTTDTVRREAERAVELFYASSGWRPEWMEENRTRVLRQQQWNQAMQDLREKGSGALYAFEKERILLANIRAGNRNEAKRIINEMLATIYLSSTQMAVLRARTIELLSCLSRAAIEDNPLLEPLIERNHEWTERLIRAGSFEGVSDTLMQALDDFVDVVYLHGMNRTDTRVRKALDFINAEHARQISLREVSRHIGLSPSRTAHLVREFAGRSVVQMIQESRIQHARHLLERTSQTCAEIAYEVGYADQSYFIRHFRRLTGTTPLRYRRVRGGAGG
jgi:AraC-like DNA-binding protein